MFTLDQLLNIHNQRLEYYEQGIVDIGKTWIEVDNALWLSVASEASKFETEDLRFEYPEKVKFIFWKNKKAIFTKVERKGVMKFLANVKAKPSLFEKLFGAFGSA